jgi:hypothetical protein
MTEVERTIGMNKTGMLYSKAHELRRRETLSEAVVTNEKEIQIVPENDWEYRVVKGRWNVPSKEQKERKAACVRQCHQKILGKVVKSRAANKKQEFEKETELAIKELKELQLMEIRQDLPKREIDTKETRRAPRDIEKEYYEKESKLQKLWMEFVLSTRIKQGWNDELPKLNVEGCLCGKSRIGYPHWPPTSKEEALQQFRYSMNKDNVHRRNLVMRWWEYFNDLAHMTPWTASKWQGRYMEAAELIKENSEIVQRELERSLTHRKRPKEWSCENYCDKVLKKKGSLMFMPLRRT